MKLSNTLILTLFSLISGIIYAQDTVNVQAFTYESTTRDSIISFPTTDHNEYEKILMYYSMRCKDGLVSTGTDRNKGCGEWDYSCNTSIIDSSIIDSILTKHPNYIIPGVTEDFFFYTTTPVHEYYLRNLIHTTIDNSNGEEQVITGSEEIATDVLFNNQEVQKVYVLIPWEQLQGLNNKKLNAIAFDELSNAEEITYFRVRLANTDVDTLTNINVEDLSFTIVHNDHLDASQLQQDIYFNKDYTLEDNSNIVLEISYTSERGQTITSSGSNKAIDNTVYHRGNDAYVAFNNTSLEVPGDNLNEITDEITIAMWIKGDADVLPTNTSIIYGVDDDNNRQINIHLPWSNSLVYWDCGYEDGGYDRIESFSNAANYTNNWNHWAFTKNTNTGRMTILLNGKEFHSGNGKTNQMNIKKLFIGTNQNGGNAFSGGIDDVVVFNRALDAEEIKQLMQYRPDPNDADYDDLKLFIDFNEASTTTALDHSNGGVTATFNSTARKALFRGEEIFKDFSTSHIQPNLTLTTGNFNRTIDVEIIRDSVEVFPREVIPYRVENGDLIQDPSLYYWEASETYVYDQLGDILEVIDIDFEDVITFQDLEYYRDVPAKFELLSFVTPYGIGLDFGLEGKTWIFDVTDFGPILKGNKRLLMDRGGQWQEDMDIQFKFIKGTPPRTVKSIQQVWPVAAPGYASITSNDVFEERTINVEEDVESMKLRMAISGHGQEGEFIPRVHYVNINGGSREISWQVWKECGFNPIYPQGGTWVYDRAGWCPGAPTDLNEHEIMEYIGEDNSFDIDYGMSSATGDSRYIVNAQLVKYGSNNYTNEASIERIVSPSNYVEYERLNPICKNPSIIIKNNGVEPLETLTISYSVEGTEPQNYYWTGSLGFLETEEVELPSFGEGRWQRDNKFNVEISNPNGKQDENLNNNIQSSYYKNVDHLEGEIIIRFFTNLASNETKWYLKDESGAIIASRNSGLSSATLYTDTLNNLDGCYTLQVEDSGQDGLSWWANNDGNGSFRIRDANDTWVTLQPDFGGEITYSFTSGVITNTKEVASNKTLDVKVFPNPSQGQFLLELQGSDDTQIKVFDHSGREIMDFYKKFNKNYDEVSLDLSSHPEGMYFLSIQSNGQIFTKKLIKM